MKRKILVGIMFFLSLSVTTINGAFAEGPGDPDGDGFWIEIVKKVGSLYQQERNFDPSDPNDIPYLHIHFPDALKKVYGSWWNDSIHEDYELADFSKGVQDIYETLDWTTVPKVMGKWNVNSWYDYPAGDPRQGQDNTYFNFVPEPISSALFVLGGALLVVRQYRRKRRNA